MSTLIFFLEKCMGYRNISTGAYVLVCTVLYFYRYLKKHYYFQVHINLYCKCTGTYSNIITCSWTCTVVVEVLTVILVRYVWICIEIVQVLIVIIFQVIWTCIVFVQVLPVLLLQVHMNIFCNCTGTYSNFITGTSTCNLVL